MKNILAIFKKELRRFFTDKRMIAMLLMPGLVIFLIYTIIGNIIPTITDEEATYVVYSKNLPEAFEVFNNLEYFKVEKHDVSELNEEEIFEKISIGEIHLYVVYEENFIEKVGLYDAASGEKAPEVELYYNSSSIESSNAFSIYSSILNSYESTLSNKFDINSGTKLYDLAKEEDLTALILTSMLPYMLLIFLFSGCMAVVTESIAGEKERGTIASLLIAPIKRHELALGKIFALSVTALVSASSSLIGLLLSLPLLMKGIDLNVAGVYGVGEVLALFAVLVVTVLLFTVMLSILSTISKTVKEASAYGIPLMLVVVVLGISTVMSTSGATNIWLYLIPIYNTAQCLVGIFSLTFNPVHFIITIAANLLLVFGGVFLLAKMFDSERIMFNK